MKGISHELINFFILFLLIPIFYYLDAGGIPLFSFGWAIGTLYLSPDLDADYSRSLNRMGNLKYLFRFTTRHRGILHNPVFWGFLFLILVFLKHAWFGAGLFGAALVHIMVDKRS
jgi:uncharacterized metal-binding protein